MSKAKDIIKTAIAKKVAPAPSFGTNPTDPWSTKANISEASEQALLMRYLYSRGINPKHVTKDTMISHSKSGEYTKWKRDHTNESFQIDEDNAKKYFTNAMNTISPDKRNAARKTYNDARNKGLTHAAALNTMWQMHKEEIEQIKELSNDKLGQYKKAASDDASKADKSGDFKRGNKRFSGIMKATNKQFDNDAKSVKKEEVETLDELNKDTLYSYSQKSNKDYDKKHKELIPQIKAGDSKSANKTASKIQRRLTGMERADSRLNSEETLDELSIGTLTNYNKKLKDSPVPDTIRKAINRVQGKEKATDRIRSDQVSKFRERMGLPNTPKNEQLSRAALIIKDMYKPKGIFEDMYDHEKEDKSTVPYGKKPKMSSTDDSDSLESRRKSEARAVLSGGTTLTGEKRDTIELDPVMRSRPGQSDPNKTDAKPAEQRKDK